ncbi:MAG: rhomboid family intramembrane serine protease [Verrucomicrobiae bacterium]|nr:rhomboid family intramembrane serine protease [Verrucomicrobiae bacterium]
MSTQQFWFDRFIDGSRPWLKREIVFRESKSADGESTGVMVPEALLKQPQEGDNDRIKKLLLGDVKQGLLYCLFICVLLFVNIPGLVVDQMTKMLAILMLFMFGIAPAINAGFQFLEYTKKRTQDELERRRVDEILFYSWLQSLPRWPGYVAVGLLVAVFLVQVFHSGMVTSFGEYQAALARSWHAVGLYRIKVTMGDEWWRIITAGLVHGGMIHLYFNSRALLSISTVLIGICRSSWIVIIFTLSVIAGSLASIYGPVRGPSVGASGGIMGLLGFLFVLTYFYKGGLPHFIKGSVVTSVFLIGMLGWLGKDFIDNAAHAGGFVAGVVLGGIAAPFSDRLLGNEKTPAYIYPVAGVCGAVLLFGVMKILLIFFGN